MDTGPLIGKWLGAGIILLCLSMSTLLIASGEIISNDQSLVTMGCFDGIEINGSMGENGWYRSNVSIIFNFTEEHTNIFYSFDKINWSEYTTPVVVSTDGVHTVWGYYIDLEGNQSEMYSSTFKIDQTSPDIIGVYTERIDRHTYRIYADVNDMTSGVNRVEFYLNDCLFENDSTAPYEWIYHGPSFYLDTLVFDNAGNSALQVAPRTPIRFSAIGFIDNVSFSPYNVNFYAKFILVYEGHSFWTLTNQQFMIYPSYNGYIGENFLLIRYRSLY